MKPFLLYALALVSLLSTSCSKEEPDPKHVIAVRLTGTNLADLGAGVLVKDRMLASPTTGWHDVYTENFASNVSKTQTIGTYDSTATIQAYIYFKEVQISTGPLPGSSVLKLELLADGKVYKTTELNTGFRNSPAYFDPYWTTSVAVETKRL
jgi:hypothetical protein